MGLSLPLCVIFLCLWSISISANESETPTIGSKEPVDANLPSPNIVESLSATEENHEDIPHSPNIERNIKNTEVIKETDSKNDRSQEVKGNVEDNTNPPFPSQSSPFWKHEADEVVRDYEENQRGDDTETGETVVEEEENRESSGNKEINSDSQRPNIILIITDDQDVELGSMEYMPETLKVFRTGGIEFRHGYVSTPICCPSRSSLLTGLYVHNHEVFTNNDNCSSINWREKFEKKTFASYLWTSGYYTSYIGKYLNKYDGSHIPHGWDEWNGLLMNSRYYNYTLNRNGKRFRYGNDLEQDYYPDSIARDALDFIERVAADPSKRPFLLVLSFPSPHGPEDSAQKYSNLFLNSTPHHTPSYNFAPNPDKQWILRVTDKMTPMLKDFTNLLMTKRLQTLQSVDIAVKDIFRKLDDTSMRDSTFAFYTSDHGYHVGNFGLVKGKSMPYEFDIRVPFFLAGPKSMVQQGITIREPVMNIDFAPTFLELANIPIPDDIDGRSMVPLIKKYCETCQKEESFEWPDVFLIESPGRRNPPTNSVPEAGSGESFGRHHKKVQKRKHREKVVFDDDEVLSLTNLCTMHPHPCMPGQKKYCRKEKNRIRFRKCRQNIDFLVSSRVFSPDPRINDPAYGHNVSLTDMTGQTCSCRIRRSTGLEYSDDDDSTIDWESERKKIDDEIEKLKQRIEYLRQRRREMRRKWLTENFPRGGTEGGKLNEERRGRDRVDNTEGRHFEDQDTLREDDYEDSNESDENERDDRESNDTVEEHDLNHNSRKLNDEDLSENKSLSIDNQFVEATFTVQNETNTTLQNEEDNMAPHSETNGVSDLPNFQEGTELEEPLPVETTRKPNGHRGKNKHHGRNKHKGIYSFNKNPSPSMSTVNEDGSCDCYNDPKWLRQKEREDRKHKKLLSKLRKKQRLFKRIEDPVERQQAETCGKEEKMNCFWHDSDHWRTEPFWTGGSFCFCMNANNNSYSCLRSVNTTHNYLYCQFVTGFKMYFDLMQDPYQLKNAINTLPASSEDWILARLYKLKQCKGKDECWSDDAGVDDSIHPSLWEQIFGRWPRKRRRGGGKRRNKYQRN